MLKGTAYSKLAKIRDTRGIDVQDYILKLAINDRVPADVVEFISSQSKLDPEFVKVLRDKRLYSTLKKADEPVEIAKALNSFITHILIEFGNNPEIEENLRENIDLDEILHAIREYLIKGNPDYLEDTAGYVLSLLD